MTSIDRLFTAGALGLFQLLLSSSPRPASPLSTYMQLTDTTRNAIAALFFLTWGGRPLEVSHEKRYDTALIHHGGLF